MPPSQFPEQAQMGFDPNMGVPERAQENSFGSTTSSDSNHGELNHLTGMEGMPFTPPSSMSSNASPEQQSGNEGNPTGEVRHGETMGYGHSPFAYDMPQTTHSMPSNYVMADYFMAQAPPSGNEGSRKGKEREREPMDHGYNPLTQYMPQTTIHSMPSSYATAENPMTLDRLTQLQQSSQLYSHQVPDGAPYGIAGSVAPSAEDFVLPETMFECNCGPNCQCVVCAVHPFNDVTMGRMGELSDLLAAENADFGGESRHQPGHGELSPNTFTGMEVDPENWESMFGLGEAIDPRLSMDGHPSASNSAYGQYGMPTAGAPMPGVAHSSNFYTMQYNLPDAEASRCPGGHSSCRCREGCPCEGCRTHTGHNL
ncbi:MAG: hypothetical protein LQ346_008929 [Caloplaca aetnensis]|nr:MAG: hypothetical protein LQ346_008929 [Caloplaca aetnensis]